MSQFKQGRIVHKVNSTASSGGTLTLTFSSSRYQQITGVQSHTIVLPDTTTLPKGFAFVISNRSTGIVTVNFNGGSLAKSMAAGSQATFLVFDNSTALGDWDISNEAVSGGTSLSASDKLSAISALGGSNYQDTENTTTKFIFNPEEVGTDVWISRLGLTQARYYVNGFDLNGYGYVNGGYTSGPTKQSTVERYDDTNNYYINRASMGSVRAHAGDFSVGGFGFAVGDDTSITSGEKYTDSTNAWAAIAAFAVGTGYMAAMTLDGYGMIAGGYTGSVVANVQTYDPVANAWYTRASRNSALYGVERGDVLNGFGYIGGGLNSGATYVGTTEYYSSAKNAWTTVSGTLGTAKTYLPNFTLNGFFYAPAGYNASVLNIMEEYSDSSGIWRVKATVPTGRFGHACNVLNGNAYLAGGSTSGAGAPTNVNEKYRNSSTALTKLVKRSNLTPSALFVSTTLNDLVVNIPARIRTDGDSWKNLTANVDSALKLNETIKTKYRESGFGYAAAGFNGSVVTSTELYSPLENTWLNRSSAISTGRYDAAAGALNGYGYMFGGYDNGGNRLSSSEKYSDTTNAWSATGASLPIATADTNGFSLNGFVFTVGGETSGTAVSSVYQFDDTTITVSTKTSMNTSRVVAGCFPLLGRGYVAGGANGGQLSSAERYDTVLNTWTTLGATLNTARSFIAGITLNGAGYCLGGWTGSASGAVDKYNPTTDSFSSVSSVPVSREDFHSFTVNGLGYAFGGDDGTTTYNTGYSYNDAANSWSSIANMNAARRGGAKNFMPGAYRNYEIQIDVPSYIAGLGANVWSAKASLNNTRDGGIGGNLGGVAVAADGAASPSTEIYNYESNVWVNGNPNPWSEVATPAGFVLYGRLYAVGMNNGTSSYNFNLDGQVWTTLATINTARSGLFPNNGGSLNGYGYLLGGAAAGGGSAVTTTEQYNVDANTWTNKASCTTATVRYFGLMSVDGFLVKESGTDFGATAANAQTSVEAYNDASNAFTSKTAHPMATSASQCLVMSGYGYSYGGRNTSSTVQANAYRYNISGDFWTQTNSYPTAIFGSSISNMLGISAGGFNGSSNLASTYQLSQSLNNIVLGVGLRVTES